MPINFKVTGYFGADNSKSPRPSQIPIEITCTNQGHRYTVHFKFLETRWISVSFDLLCRLAASAREGAAEKGTAECETEIKLVTMVSGRQYETTVKVTMRSNGIVDMICFEIEHVGQLLVPYNKIETKIRKDKSRMA